MDDVFQLAVTCEMPDALDEVHEAFGSGVDDTSLGQDGKLLGCVQQRLLGREKRIMEKVHKIGRLCGLLVNGLGPLPHDREHRPLDRVKDGLVGRMRRPPGCLGKGSDREMVLVLDLGAQAVEKLGKNEPGVSPGTGEGGVSNRPESRLQRLADHGRLGDRTHGRRQVGPGVRVRNGEDVDPVEVVLVLHDGVAARQESQVQPPAVEIADLHDLYSPCFKTFNFVHFSGIVKIILLFRYFI